MSATIEKFEDLKGETVSAVDGKQGEDELTLTLTDGRRFKLYHVQNCCESVYLSDVEGNLSDLIGAPLVQAEEVSNADAPAPKDADSYTWTFYKLATAKGYVTLRWLGESNGYYSESVDFSQVEA